MSRPLPKAGWAHASCWRLTSVSTMELRFSEALASAEAGNCVRRARPLAFHRTNRLFGSVYIGNGCFCFLFVLNSAALDTLARQAASLCPPASVVHQASL